MNKILKRNIKKHLKALPSSKTIAKDAVKGIAKKGWYTRALKTIKYLYGKDYRLFIGILAATSPRQTVELNMRMTQTIYGQWVKLKRKTGLKTINTLAKLSDLPAREGNVKRAFNNEKLSGNKVESFKRNLLGDLDAVTLDTWMLTYIGTSNDNMLASKAGYIAYSHRVRRAAKELGWSPAEVQECLWSYTYAKVNKCDIKDVPEFDIQDIIV